MGVFHRLFYAVKPRPPAAALIGRQRDAVDGIHRGVSDDHLHTTMGISADYPIYPAMLVEQMLQIGDRIDAAPIEMSLDLMNGSAHSIALRPRRAIATLSRLHRALAEPIARLGLGRPGWSFNAHCTLGYREGEPFTRDIRSIAWRADEFVLIHSHVGANRHDILRRWPLRARQGDLFA